MASPAASWSQTRDAAGMARQCCRPVGFRKKGAESLAFLKGNLAWIFRPIDDLEEHSPLEHFGFEGGRVLFPLRCFADTEPSFLALLLERVVDGKCSAHAFVHHREAFAREGLIVHRTPLQEAATVARDGFPNQTMIRRSSSQPAFESTGLVLAPGELRILPLVQLFQICQAVYRQLLGIRLSSRR
jgi:hypothetical protein